MWNLMTTETREESIICRVPGRGMDWTAQSVIGCETCSHLCVVSVLYANREDFGGRLWGPRGGAMPVINSWLFSGVRKL